MGTHDLGLVDWFWGCGLPWGAGALTLTWATTPWKGVRSGAIRSCTAMPSHPLPLEAAPLTVYLCVSVGVGVGV